MSKKGSLLFFISTIAIVLILIISHIKEAHSWKTYQLQFNKEEAMRLRIRLKAEGLPEEVINKRCLEVLNRPLRIKEISLPRWGVVERCLTCHDGIEEVSPSHPIDSFGCTICHGGNGLATEKKAAHRGLIGGRNPSDLRFLEQSCGRKAPDGTPCHEGHGDPFRDQVGRVRKSLMATMAGVISATRFAWRAQEKRDSRYGSMGIRDEDGTVPSEDGAISSLETIPLFSNEGMPKDRKGRPIVSDLMGNTLKVSGEFADDHWRKFCSRCHLWNARPEGLSSHPGGCASCHFLREKEGRYRGKDPTVDKDKEGHPSEHKMTVAIPTAQCVRCHNRSARIGLSYQGLMESDRYGTPYWRGGFNPERLSGIRFVLHLAPDIHWEKGMHCIDCHTGFDVMGDGNIYSRMNQQVEIRCSDCHGKFDQEPSARRIESQSAYPVWSSRLFSGWGNVQGEEILLTSKGRPIVNAKKTGKGFILYGKVDGKKRSIPVITGRGTAHSIPGHRRMACFSCHSRWAPQCYGCHDYRRASETQIDPNTNIRTSGRWMETRGYYRFESPSLGINDRGEVSPVMPGCQVFFTALDSHDNIIPPYRRYVFRGGSLGSGMVFVPVNPHTTRKEVRLCEGCHLDPKVLGFGVGFLKLSWKWEKNEFLSVQDWRNSGLPIGFALESLIDPRGNPLQSSSHPRARPFNREELRRIIHVGPCLLCHERYEDPIYRDFENSLKKSRCPGSSKYRKKSG